MHSSCVVKKSILDFIQTINPGSSPQRSTWNDLPFTTNLLPLLCTFSSFLLSNFWFHPSRELRSPSLATFFNFSFYYLLCVHIVSCLAILCPEYGSFLLCLCANNVDVTDRQLHTFSLFIFWVQLILQNTFQKLQFVSNELFYSIITGSYNMNFAVFLCHSQPFYWMCQYHSVEILLFFRYVFIAR